MGKNLMPEVAKLLGIEMDKWYKLKDKPGIARYKHRLTLDGLIDEAGFNRIHTLNELLKGEEGFVMPVTYRSKFMEQFPKANLIEICREHIYGDDGCSEDMGRNCDECWDEEYKEDINNG